jgi:hypothetical protein
MTSLQGISRSSRNALALALTVAALATGARAVHAGGTCPASEFDLGGLVTQQDAAAASASAGSRVVSYDLPHAHLFVHHDGGLGATVVTARDAYDVIGVPAGTPVDATVELVAPGYVQTDGCGGTGCWGELRARITTPSTTLSQASGATIFAAATVPVSVTVTVPVHFVAGTPLTIEFRLEGYRAPGGSHVVEGNGSWTFKDLPEGVVVTSCQGFVDPSTPARPATWGSLKAHYR